MVGHNCRMLQGSDTQPRAIDELAAAVRNDTACEVQMLNHHKSGAAFTNQLALSPTLRIGADVELVVAVLRTPPHPLIEERCMYAQ